MRGELHLNQVLFTTQCPRKLDLVPLLGELCPMISIDKFKYKVSFLLTDIDDTLTNDGRMLAKSYESLWKLHAAGVFVIPVTGRPAGWCELIARQWPVAAVVGENGAFFFRYHNRKMIRHFAQSESDRVAQQEKLFSIAQDVLKKFPGTALASDQFCRMFDVAIDFCEDVPALDTEIANKICQHFQNAGATAKVSSIHVNAWFGVHSKLSQSLKLLHSEFGIGESEAKSRCAFVGDSPNDEPMWSFFEHSFGVGDLDRYADILQHPPKYSTPIAGGEGFAAIAEQILKVNA